MDFEKYYKLKKDGTYCIHFPNKKGFSEEEINKMFSSYGNILNVSWKGDIMNGLIFIRYKTLQETLHCLESLQKSNDIRILPQKDKIGKQKIQQSSNERQAGRIDNSSQETFVIDKYHSNTSYSNKIFTCEEKPAYRKNSDYVDNFPNSSSSKYDYKSYVNAIRSDKINLLVDEKNSQYPTQQNYDNKVSYNQVAKQQNKQATKQEIIFHKSSKLEAKTYSIWNKDTFNSNKIPSLISESETKGSDIKKDRSLPTCTRNTLHKSIVTMQEVIVANIHANYGVHYILHLFEKYNPIAATLVKTIFKTDIRYCLVYFIDIDDVLAVEKEFDNFTLSGRNLIVLRKSQLNKDICN